MTVEKSMKYAKLHLLVSGISFTLILVLWPVLLAFYKAGGTNEEQFRWIADHMKIHKLQFFFAFLISPALIYLQVALLNFRAACHDQKPGASGHKSLLNSPVQVIGLLFLGAYLVFNSIAYASQVYVLPGLLESGNTSLALLWHFNAEGSVVYFLNQMGYCFWAVATLILFSGFLKTRGYLLFIGSILVISGVLSVLAFAGLLLGSPGLNSLTFFSGIILLPVGILGMILQRQTARQTK